MTRPSWSTYFLDLAQVVSSRATCDRLHVGCVLVRNRQVLVTGYNGSMSGSPHCTEAGCLIQEGRCVRTIHAEANALTQAAAQGISVAGATAYITHSPCWECSKLLVNAGIKKIVYREAFRETGHLTGLPVKVFTPRAT